jgi:hypothetical protein
MRGNKNRHNDSYSENSEDDGYDEEANWAGGGGFVWEGEAHKWKSTRKVFCWPLYSESVTITPQEVHIKRNDCPALPRECRPFRAWSVAPLRNVRSYAMRKTVSNPTDWCLLFFVCLIIGLIGGGLVSAFALPSAVSLAGLETASSVLGFNVDSSFFVFSTIIGVSACCLGFLFMTLRAPLRLLIAIEGNQNPECFAIDLIPGRVQPEEIKAKIEEFITAGRIGM